MVMHVLSCDIPMHFLGITPFDINEYSGRQSSMGEQQMDPNLNTNCMFMLTTVSI